MREGTVIAGKYRLERPLARGGMGAVWVARHLQLDEEVAIKFMDISLPAVADARVRFEREAKAAARIRSPHVVQILDHGMDGEMPYIVMELLEGEHLGARLKREGRLSLSATAVIAEQVSKALQRAHRAGIIHRDLKPANVFLARVDEDEIVKILDFGIVKAMSGGGSLSGEATKSDVLMGSPNYMSPEQARGARSVDHRTDLWSLGVVLFRAITGRMAFSGDSVVDVILKICTGPIPVPTAVAPDLPREVDAFFRRALERDPARRFSSAREMGAEFVAMVKALGPRADQVGPLPSSSIEPPDHVQSSVMEVASGDIVVSTPAPPDGTLRWRQLLQGSVETPTVPHARSRSHPSSRGAASSEAKGSPNSSPISTPATVLQPQKEASTSLASLLRPPAEPQPMTTSLASLLRPPSGSPANAASALLKPSSPFGKVSTTPVPPAIKGHVLAKSVPSSRPSPLLNAPEPEPTPVMPESEGEPSAFIRLTRSAGSANQLPPQSDRSAEIAQFIDEAFLALQASDPAPATAKLEPPVESTPLPEGLLRRGAPIWPASSTGSPSVAALLGKAPPSSQSNTAAAALLGKSSANPSLIHPDPPSTKREPTPPPPVDETSIIEPSPSSTEAGRLKAHRAEHADRISKLVDEGFAALKRGDREHARACWSEALDLDPTDRMLKLNLRKLETKGRP